LPVSDIAEEVVSVTDLEHYVYYPRLVYLDRVLHAAPVFARSKRTVRGLHEDYVRKELRRKGACLLFTRATLSRKHATDGKKTQTNRIETVKDLIIHRKHK